MENTKDINIDPLLKEKLEVILGDIASYAMTIETLAESVLNNDLKNGHVAVMLQCMSQRIGWIADQGLDEMLCGQVRGSAKDWMLLGLPFFDQN